MRSIRESLVVGVFAALVVAASPACANTFAATELSYDSALLSQFNLINLNNLSISPGNGSQIYAAGRVITGSLTTGANGYGACLGTNISGGSACSGNTTIGASSSTTAGVTTPSSSNLAYGALTVFGNVAGYTGATGGGTVYVGGNVTGNSAATSGSMGYKGDLSGASSDTLNVVGTLSSTATAQDTSTYNTTQTAANRGGTLTNVTTANYSQTLASVFPFSSETNSLTTPLKNLYSGLANLPGSPGVSKETLPSNQSGVFTSAVDYTTVVNGTTYKYGVIQTSITNLANESSSFTGIANGSGNAATFVIVNGDGAGLTLPTLTNNDSKVIYDFVDAHTLNLGGNFNASILAPLANLTSGTGTVNGTVVVASMTESQNLYNGNAFTGDLTGLTNLSYNPRVPEPASASLVVAGLAAFAWARRRRR